MKGNLFAFMARIRIPTVLRSHQYNYTETVQTIKRSKSVTEKFLEIERGGGGVSAGGKQNIPWSFLSL